MNAKEPIDKSLETQLAILGLPKLLEICLDCLNDAIVISEAESTDKPGSRIIWANKVFYERNGYSPAEIIGQSPRILQGPKTDRGALDKVRIALNDCQPVRTETLNYRKDGSTYWNQFEIVPLANELGCVTHWLSVQHDITDHKNSEDALRECHERFVTLFDNSPISIFHSTPEGRFLAANPACANMLGYASADEIIEQITDIRTQVYFDPQQRDELVGKLLQQDSWVATEGQFVRKDGSVITVSIKGRKVINPYCYDGKLYLEGFIEDITERKQHEDALRDSEFRWKFAIEGSGDGVWDWNIQTDEAKYSKRWKEMLGYAEHEILPTNDEWVLRIHPDDRSYVAATMQAYLAGQTEIYVVEYRLQCKNGSYKWILGRGMIVSRDDDSKPLRMIGTHTDITKHKELEAQVRELAFYDPLTKLANRLLLNDRLTQALSTSKRNGSHIAMIFLDLDNFKPLNDTHGHVVGDLLLREAAKRLKSCVREIDTVARFGGDEFVVMLSNLHASRGESISFASIVAEKISNILSVPYLLNTSCEGQLNTVVEHQCTASIGVVIFNHEVNQSDIMEWADSAMYQAKEAGRNLIRFYSQKPILS